MADPTVGDMVRERITGFTGIVTAITTWLNGCKRCGVQPVGLHEGKPIEAEWYDLEQVDVIERGSYFKATFVNKDAEVSAPPPRTGGPQNDPVFRKREA